MKDHGIGGWDGAAEDVGVLADVWGLTVHLVGRDNITVLQTQEAINSTTACS